MEDGYFLVEEYDEKLGHKVERIIDAEGKEKFYSDYEAIYGYSYSPYCEAVKVIDGERKYCLIDRDGKVVLPFESGYSSTPRELLNMGKFIFELDERKGIKNFDGVVEVEAKYEDIQLMDDRFYIVKEVTEDGKTVEGLIKHDGKAIIPTGHKTIMGLGDGIMMLQGLGCTIAKLTLK